MMNSLYLLAGLASHFKLPIASQIPSSNLLLSSRLTSLHLHKTSPTIIRPFSLNILNISRQIRLKKWVLKTLFRIRSTSRIPLKQTLNQTQSFRRSPRDNRSPSSRISMQKAEIHSRS